MTKLIIKLEDSEYEKLTNTASAFGKTVQHFIHEWISNLPEIDEDFDIKSDPVYQMEGYESEAPSDLSKNIDKYIYEDKE